MLALLPLTSPTCSHSSALPSAHPRPLSGCGCPGDSTVIHSVLLKHLKWDYPGGCLGLLGTHSKLPLAEPCFDWSGAFPTPMLMSALRNLSNPLASFPHPFSWHSSLCGPHCFDPVVLPMVSQHISGTALHPALVTLPRKKLGGHMAGGQHCKRKMLFPKLKSSLRSKLEKFNCLTVCIYLCFYCFSLWTTELYACVCLPVYILLKILFHFLDVV